MNMRICLHCAVGEFLGLYEIFFSKNKFRILGWESIDGNLTHFTFITDIQWQNCVPHTATDRVSCLKKVLKRLETKTATTWKVKAQLHLC